MLILVVLVTAIITFAAMAVVAIIETSSINNAEKAECQKIAQKFDPPARWRWSRLRKMQDPWGSGCEINMSGTWYPGYMVQPELK